MSSEAEQYVLDLVNILASSLYILLCLIYICIYLFHIHTGLQNMNCDSSEVRDMLTAITTKIWDSPWTASDLEVPKGVRVTEAQFRSEYELTGQNIGNALWYVNYILYYIILYTTYLIINMHTNYVCICIC